MLNGRVSKGRKFMEEAVGVAIVLLIALAILAFPMGMFAHVLYWVFMKGWDLFW